MRTRQKRVATDTWRSLGCLTTPLEHWSKRKPTVNPGGPSNRQKKKKKKKKKFSDTTRRLVELLRPNHCGRHLGKINSHTSTYVKVWRYTFGRITRVLMGKSWGKLL